MPAKKLTTKEFLQRVNEKWDNEWELIDGIEYQGYNLPMTLRHKPCGTVVTKQAATKFVLHNCLTCFKKDEKKIRARLEKAKKTSLERYGVEFPAQNIKIQEKGKKTNLERYGVEFPIQNKKIQENYKNNFLKKYGVENPMQNKEIQKKFRKTKLNNLYSIEQQLFHNKETLKDGLINLGKKLGRLPYIDEIIEESGYSDCTNLYELGLVSLSYLYQTRQGFSKAEEEISNFLSQYTVIEQRNRSILNGQEIDIYLPQYKCGIEYNGIYWHSSSPNAACGVPKPSNYHLNKRLLANSKNIHLIQIFESEYLQNPKKCLGKLLYYTGIQKDLSELAQKYKVDQDIINTDEEFIYAIVDLCWTNPFSNCYLDNNWELSEELSPQKFEANGFELYDAGWLIYKKKIDK